jgi:hypothetical protein
MPKSGSSFRPHLSSNVGTKSNWERDETMRWSNRLTQSDSGIDMQRNEMTVANDYKKEQDTDLQTPPPRKWQDDRSPAAARSPESSWAGAQMIPGIEEVEAEQEGASRSRPALGSVVSLRRTTGPGATTPPTLSERRNAIITTTAQATTGPSGNSASPDSVAGHSGVDHPPGIDKIEPGVSFGEVPPQLTTEPEGSR